MQGVPGTMTEEVAITADPRTDLARNRTGMAKFRTQLAMDRTTLAWIRTTLTMATFGFGMIGYFRSVEESTGTARSVKLHQALVVLSILATVLSGLSHWRSLGSLRAGEQLVTTRWPLSITVAMLLSLLGLAGLWYALSH
jgi:putative membrane protein